MASAVAKSFPSRPVQLRHGLFEEEGAFRVDSCQVAVEFVNNLSIQQVVETLNKLPNPQIVAWYIGCYGLRSGGVQFYRDFLISPILKNRTQATFWLVDLTAWGALKKTQCSILNFNHACEVIENASHRQIRCIKSAEIFAKMQKIDGKNLINYFKNALGRSFISQSSKHFSDSHILVRDVFSSSCPVVADWYDSDASKSYSVLQYLEGCLLVEEVFMQLVANGRDDIQIVFAIPNDELKYYKDSQNSFQKDVQFLISQKCVNLNIKDIKLEVKFLAFNYGNALHDRPYSAPGKVLKKHNLSFSDIIGDLGENEESPVTEIVYAHNVR